MAARADRGRLPNVLVIGAQKAGTSALHAHLSAHPDVFASATKELHFFSHNFGRARDLDEYRSHFDAAGGRAVVLESSTTYTTFPAAPGTAERIHATLGDIKLIYLLRDPIERMRAGYVQALSAGAETRPIRDALLHDTRYLFPSLYALQLEQYLPLFPRERILCLRQEDLRARPEATLDEVLAFLDLEPGWRPPEVGRSHNVTEGKRVPRRWARAVGGAIQRPGLAWTHRAVGRLQRDSGLVTRPLAPREADTPTDVRDALLEVIRRDLRDLRGLLGEGWDWGHLTQE